MQRLVTLDVVDEGNLTMGRKRKMKDPFGLRRASQSMTLAFNKMRGRMAEDSFEMNQRLQGHEVRKIHKGGDFVVRKGMRGKPTRARAPHIRKRWCSCYIRKVERKDTNGLCT